MSSKEAWIRWIGLQTHRHEDGADLIVPVTGATTETVQCLLEKPVFARLALGSPDGGRTMVTSSGWQSAIAEGIFAIALLEDTTLFDSQTDKVPEGVLTKNWCVTLRFRPRAIFEVTKDNDA